MTSFHALYRFFSTLAAWAVPCALILGGCSASADGDPVASPWFDRTATLAYWTPARMAAAERIPEAQTTLPVEAPITPGGDDIGYATVPPPYKRAEASRATGILFFHDPFRNEDAHCTASVLATPSRRLIVTAAHCLVAFSGLPSLEWLQYPLFVPAYDGARPLDDAQRAPFGYWPLRRVYVPAIAAQNPAYLLRSEYDLAIAGVFDQLGRPIGDVLDAGLAPRVWAETELPGPMPRMKTIGYPMCEGDLCQGDIQYPGSRQYACVSTGRTGPSTRSIALPNCGIGSGNSGGPILADDDHAPASTVMAVVHTPVDQTPLLPDTYPAMERMAEEDFAIPAKGTRHGIHD